MTSPHLASAIDAVYLGGQVGNVALTGDLGNAFSNAIGFGVDLGLRTNSLLDVTAHFQHSSHSGGTDGMSLNDLFLSADVHLLQVNDFDFALAFGPGFYFFNAAAAGNLPSLSHTNFGLNFGALGDVVVSDNFRIGLDGRYHAVFGNIFGNTGGAFWTIMLRAGVLFEI